MRSMTLPHARPARRLLLATAAAALLAGCASTPSTPEQAVAARANARWQAQIAGDFEKAYGYLSPASRALTPYTVWRGSIRGFTTWKSAEVASVTCETSEKCIARVKVVHEPMVLRRSLGSIDSAVDETWLLDGGEWWLFHTP
jgi:type IV pilus biogenesis protein CpaD/CtpE